MDYTKRFPSPQSQTGAVEMDAGLRAYMLRVYNYMAGALGLTGIAAFGVSSSPELMQLFFTTPLKWVVMFFPLAFVFFMGAKLHSLSLGSAKAALWAYAAMMGIGLAPIFMLYTGASVARVFLISASMFGVMSLYGYTTKRDLTGFGSFLIMGMWGLIIASLVNFFFVESTMLHFIISAIGVLIFTGLTAYDTQSIKSEYYHFGGTEMAAKMGVFGALRLYIDFIGIFIYLIQFLGERR